MEDTRADLDLLERQQAHADELFAKHKAAALIKLVQEKEREMQRADDAPPVETQRPDLDIASSNVAGCVRGVCPVCCSSKPCFCVEMATSLARKNEVEREAANLHKEHPWLKRWDPKQRQGLEEQQIRRTGLSSGRGRRARSRTRSAPNQAVA